MDQALDWVKLVGGTLVSPTSTFWKIMVDSDRYRQSMWGILWTIHGLILAEQLFAIIIQEYPVSLENMEIVLWQTVLFAAAHGIYLWGVFLVGKYWHGNPYRNQVLPVIVYAQVVWVLASIFGVIGTVLQALDIQHLQMGVAAWMVAIWWSVLNVKAIRVLNPSKNGRRPVLMFLIALIPSCILLSWRLSL